MEVLGTGLSSRGARCPRRRLDHRLPLFQGILPLDRSNLTTDVIAGVTLAALGIPEVMGYAKIAEMPVITGLYTILIPIAVFAVLGSSATPRGRRRLGDGRDHGGRARRLGADRVRRLRRPRRDHGDPRGRLPALARIIRLGFLADFLSRSVLIGFLTGVGIQVAMGQRRRHPRRSRRDRRHAVEVLGTARADPGHEPTTLAVSVSILGVILVLKAINPKIPGAFIAVIGAIVVSCALDLSTHGVAVLGTVPGASRRSACRARVGTISTACSRTAASIFIVILAQSAATSRAYAAKYNEAFDENVDLVGLCRERRGRPVGDVRRQREPDEDADGRRRGRPQPGRHHHDGGDHPHRPAVPHETAAVHAQAVLASIVFLIGIELVDHIGMRKILRWRVDEFVIALTTAAVVVVIGVEQGSSSPWCSR